MTQRFEVDGVPVIGHEGVFSRAFEMTEANAKDVSYDRTYVLVVVATTLPPGYRTDKYGDLIRRDRFQVTAARVASVAMGAELAEMFELDMFDQGSLPFGQPATDEPILTPALESWVQTQRAAEAPQPAVVASNSMPASGPPASVGVPVGVPVGRVEQTGDDTLRRFLEGGS